MYLIGLKDAVKDESKLVENLMSCHFMVLTSMNWLPLTYFWIRYGQKVDRGNIGKEVHRYTEVSLKLVFIIKTKDKLKDE